MSEDCPLARSEGLITEELDGELLLYDSQSNLAHALDAESAAMWRACDGHTDSSALAVRCATSEADARTILARLGELGLLEDTHTGEDGDTRRGALRKIAVAGAGVAAIDSILVPAAAAQGSCVPPGTCVSPGQTCCSGHPIDGLGQCVFVTGDMICCVPAGGCATTSRDSLPQVTCCNGTGTPDSTCTLTGVRCT